MCTCVLPSQESLPQNLGRLLCAQELAVPHIISGKDVVLAAETGSGKTLAYVAPIASVLLQRSVKAAAVAQAATPDATTTK